MTAWERFGPDLLAIAARSNYQEEDGTLRPDWLRRGILAAAAALRGPVRGSDRLFRDLVWELDPGHLPGLEAECRRSVLGSYTWYGFRAADLHLYLDLPLALAAFTWHPNGHLREPALRALPDDANAVPFVILRLNDWVPEIRRLAGARMEALLDPARAADLVRWLPLVLWLETCGRADHLSTVRRALSLLRRPECRQALEAGLDLPWRRTLYPLALQAADDPGPVLDQWRQSHCCNALSQYRPSPPWRPLPRRGCGTWTSPSTASTTTRSRRCAAAPACRRSRR